MIFINLENIWTHRTWWRIISRSTYSSTAFKISSSNVTSFAVIPNEVASTIVSEHLDVISKISMLSLPSNLSTLSTIRSALSIKTRTKLLMMFCWNEKSRFLRWTSQCSAEIKTNSETCRASGDHHLRLATSKPLSSLRNLYKNDFSRHFGEFRTCSMSFGSLTKMNSVGPIQNLIRLFCWYFSSMLRIMLNRSEETDDWETPYTLWLTLHLTLLIRLEKLVWTSDHRVSLWPGNFVSELVQRFVSEEILHRAKNQNNRADQQKRHDQPASSSQHELRPSTSFSLFCSISTVNVVDQLFFSCAHRLEVM